MDRIEKLQEFLKQNSGDDFLKHALALEYIKAGEEDKAKKLFEGLLANNPDYCGSYYHLGKLYERINNIEMAIEIYEKGMDACKRNKDNHAYNELKAAYEELVM